MTIYIIYAHEINTSITFPKQTTKQDDHVSRADSMVLLHFHSTVGMPRVLPAPDLSLSCGQKLDGWWTCSGEGGCAKLYYYYKSGAHRAVKRKEKF